MCVCKQICMYVYIYHINILLACLLACYFCRAPGDPWPEGLPPVARGVCQLGPYSGRKEVFLRVPV